MSTRIGTVLPPGLNLRICAYTGSDILDQLPHGERLFVSDLGTADGWVFVTVDRTRQSGYVMRKYIDIIEPPPAPAPRPQKDSNTAEYWLWAAVVIVAGLVATLFALNSWQH